MPELADLVLYNARIYSLDDNDSIHESVACKNGIIVGLGTTEEILSQFQAKKSMDVHGKTVIPGFIDLHCHLQGLGEEKLFVVDLRGCTSLEDAINRIQERARITPRGDLIQVRNWDESIWPEARYLTRWDLDRATTVHPVIAYREDGHMASLNSLAIKEFDLDRLRHVKGVDVDPITNELTGVVRDVPLEHDQLRLKLEDSLKAVLKGFEIAASLGITTVHDIIKGHQIAPYLQAWRLGKMKIRVTMIPIAKSSLKMLEHLGMTGNFGDLWLRFGYIKYFVDGSLGARTAWLSKSYHDQENELGKAEYTLSELVRELQRARDLFFPVAIHAIGDAAIKLALDALERIDELPSISLGLNHGFDHHHSVFDRIEHAELLTDELLKRIKRLGVALSMQPNFLKWQVPSGLYEQRVGKERTKIMNAFKKIVNLGIPLGFGSDCMPIGPLYGIHWAVNHPVSEFQLSTREAVLAYTRWAAEISGEQALKGTIEIGKLADMVVLSEDPFNCPSQFLKELTVVMTIVNGKVIHESHGDVATAC